MRGHADKQQSIFVIFDLEQRVPMDHPLRKIKRWADGVLAEMSRDFNKAYGMTGRPGIPPEQLIKALLLQSLYSIPSETKLVEAIQWNVLYRWFLDLPMEQDAWTQEAFRMENRSGLCVAITVDFADGHAERRNALRMLRHVKRRHRIVPRTVGMDAGYKAGEFLLEVEDHGATPHVPLPDDPIKDASPAGAARRRAKRRMKAVGYRLSQRGRKRCEQIIGWGKTVAGLARTRFVGHERIESSALICGAAYNLLRMTKLVPT